MEQELIYPDPPQIGPPPIKLAFVIENEVVDILHTDERLAAIFMSNPVIVEVTENFYDENNNPSVVIGATYNSETQQFTNPS